ncbi:MAG: sodium/solute symporter [Kiritimatiellales bacterium]
MAGLICMLSGGNLGAAAIHVVPVEPELILSTNAVSVGSMSRGAVLIEERGARLISVDDGSVIAETEFQNALRFPAVATAGPDSLILAGGIVDGKISGQVFCLQFDGTELSIKELPTLPVPLAAAGALVMDGVLYIAGGLMSFDPLLTSPELFSLNISSPNPVWERQIAFPGTGRIFPAMGTLSSELYIFGGWSPEQRCALKDGWGFRIKPLDGTVHTGWRQLNDMPEPLAGSPIYSSGQAHFTLFGGCKSIAPLDSVFSGETVAEKSEQIWIYHTVTDTWISGGELNQPVAGGAIVQQKSGTFLISPDVPVARIELGHTVKRFGWVDYSILAAYFLLMAGVGVYFAARQKSSVAYALGGRNVKWWAAAVSMFATGTSAISFMAIPAMAFRTNLVWLTPLMFTPVVVLLQSYGLFPLLRRLRLTSTFEYLEQRFHPSLRFLASLQNIVFNAAGRISISLLLPSLAISAVSGIDVGMSVLIMGVIATFYTATGGFEAVVWTDVIQGALMFLGVILMIFCAVDGLPGGWDEFVSTGKEFGRFDMAIWSWDCSKPVLWMYFFAILVEGISVVSNQPAVQRVFSTPLKDVRRLSAMSMACGVLIAVLVTMAGISIFAYFHAHPQLLDPGMRNDQVIPLFVVQGVPAGIAGLIIAGIFAAALSTLAGSMNSVATLVGEDFYKRISRRATDRMQLVLMKVSCVLTGAFGTGLAYVMAQMPMDSIFRVWMEIIALLGGGFVGIYVLGIFTRRTSSIGAAIGAIGSIVCTVLVKNYTSLHWIFYTPFAMIACILLGYTASFIFLRNANKELSGLTVYDVLKRGDSEEI